MPGKVCGPVLIALAIAVAGCDAPALDGPSSGITSPPAGPAIYDLEDLYDQAYQDELDRQAELQVQEIPDYLRLR